MIGGEEAWAEVRRQESLSTRPRQHVKIVFGLVRSGPLLAAFRSRGVPSPVMRWHCSFLAIGFLAVLPGIAHSQWAPGGVPVPGSGGGTPLTCGDLLSGVFVAWSAGDVSAQHLTGAGTVAPEFPAGGLAICSDPADQYLSGIIPDGQGGAILTWLDYRNFPNVPNFYAQRITGNGAIATGWTTNGNPLALTQVDFASPGMVADGSGGALFIWNDLRSGNPELYAQHLIGTGEAAPNWPSTGVPVCVVPCYPGDPQAIPDEAGGTFVVWNDIRGPAEQHGVYATRVTGSGSIASGWPVNGLMVAQGRILRHVVRDGAGGAYLGLALSSHAYQGFDSTLFILHMTGSGQTAQGWAAGGTTICNAPDVRTGLKLAPDGSGGVFAQWTDYRGLGYSNAYDTHMMPDGTFALGWSVNGVRASTLPGGNIFGSDLVADGVGGLYVAYEFHAGSVFSYLQHLGNDGMPSAGWSGDGLSLNPEAPQAGPVLVSDGAGGAIVVWDNRHVRSLYAQRYAIDGPVPVEISLASAEVKDGHVALDWFVGGSSLSSATVLRRTELSAWSELGSVTIDGTGHLRYEDRDITPGQRYAYRLGYLDAGVQRFASETWVDVPAPTLALEGLRPNPATGPLSVSFALPDASPASLEVLDVSGRRLVQQEVGSMGAGSHLVRLDEGRSLAPGIYWLRLRQGARSLLTRGAVVR